MIYSFYRKQPELSGCFIYTYIVIIWYDGYSKEYWIGGRMMEYRIAEIDDFFELAEMRWDFKTEGKDMDLGLNKGIFISKCHDFFVSGNNNSSWTHWVAVDNKTIVSHISINHIRKIPKPNRIDDEYGYITNVYTRPEYRGRGIGSKLMDSVKEWAVEKDYEILIVWPSHKAVNFYERKGFRSENEIMEMILRDDD